jgi:spermidine synthase
MTTYKEEDGNITREYKLADGPIYRNRSEKALIEIVPTQEFGLALFLDNELQLTEKDEYIYHEMLVHPCLATSQSQERICIIGGGDGCAVREVLKWSGVKSVDVIDWDKQVTDLFTTSYSFLNKNSLQDSRVRVQNRNIQELLREDREYDCILIDLVDPNPLKDGYANLWYDTLFLAKHWMRESGSVIVNLGGVLPWKTHTVDSFVQFVKTPFSCPQYIHKVFVPSFGREWCFLLLTWNQINAFAPLPSDLLYFSEETWKTSRTWSKDFQDAFHLNLSNNTIEGND